MRDNLKSRWIRYLISLTLIFGLGSCVLTKRANEENYYLHITPPNGVKIGGNLFYDQTEVRNIDWREYMYWTKRILGANSEEYLATIPDTNVWKEKDSCLNLKMRSYLHLRRFEDYPVVGVSQKQAELYSKWRSDRVFEFILLKYGIIKMDSGQKRETCFTIERYLNGTYHNQKPDPDFKFYPEYRLPSPQEWKMALHYADSVEQAYLLKCNTKSCKKCKSHWPEFQSDITPCVNDSFKLIPVRNVLSGCLPEKRHFIYNLRGNVSEWTSKNEINAGGGWAHNRQKILTNDTFQSKAPNAWTGFRNICEWKEYRNKTP